MGRPLKIKKSTTKDIGFNDFGNVTVPVIPAGLTTTEFLGVVGGANAGIATSAYPVVKVTANVNGQEGAAYIITQKGATKYLVSGENSVNAGSFTPGFSYQITALGNTNWTAIGAGVKPQVGHFTAGFSSSFALGLLTSAIPAKSSLKPNCCSMEALFSWAHSSHRCNSFIWSSMISVRCTVAGFLPHTSHNILIPDPFFFSRCFKFLRQA